MKIFSENEHSVTFALNEKTNVTVERARLKRYGLEETLKYYNIRLPNQREKVFQDGKLIGSMPAGFHPLYGIKSNSFFYRPRPGDFKYNKKLEGWEACRTIMSGDFEAIEGFRWERE